MAEFNKLNLTPRPIYPEPSPTAAALREVEASTFEVGSGSEIAKTDRIAVLNSEQRNWVSDDAGENAREIAELARDKFNAVAYEARVRMNDIAERASNIADEAGQRIHDLRDRLNERLPVWKRQARVRVDDARLLARQKALQVDAKAKRFPIETIIAAAGTGFVLGASLRIWRSNRG